MPGEFLCEKPLREIGVPCRNSLFQEAAKAQAANANADNMSSKPKDDANTWNLELTKSEILLPVFQPYVNELTELKWLEIDPDKADDTVKKIVSDLCVEIINIIAKTIFDTIQRKQANADSPSWFVETERKAPDLVVSEKEVLESLGDVIPNTLSEAIGDSDYITTQNSEEMNWLMAEEITEQINSNLYTVQVDRERDPVFTDPKPSRLKQIVAKATELIRCSCCRRRRGQQSQVVVIKQEQIVEQQEDYVVEQEVINIRSFIQEEEVVEVTKVVYDEDLTASAKDITENMLADSIKDILNEQMNSLNVFGQNNFTQDEYDQLMASISLDIDRVANRTSAEIMGSSLLQSDSVELLTEVKLTTRRRANRWIQALFIHRFFRESILRFVSRLKGKSSATDAKQDALLKQLFQGGEQVVNSMIPAEGTAGDAAKMSLYEKMANDIQSDEKEVVRGQLCDIVVRYLRPQVDRDEVWNELDFFMKLTWNWLNQQAQRYRSRTDSASVSLREIDTAAAVAIPEFTEDFSLVESITYDPEFDEDPVSLMARPAVADEVLLAPVEMSPQAINRKEKLCNLLISGLVSQILDGLRVHIPLDVIKAIISKLKEMLMLELSGRDISFRANGPVINRINKAALKDLSADMGSINVLRINLMLQEEQIYKDIIRALTKNLTLLDNKSGVITSFRTVFKTMSRPFNKRD